MELVQARAEAVLVPLIVMIWVILRCLKQAFVKALPQELGYSWSSKAGFLGITILDAIGRELPVPMDLCVSFENLHGVIEIYFRGKKGHRKVTRGEYCLTYGDGSDIKPISTERDLVRARRPGSRLAMFMEVNVGRKPRNTPHQVEEEIEGTQICPQCGVANYPTKDDEFGVKCIGCGSEVRIFEDVTEISKVIAPEYDNELGSESYTGTLSRSIRLRSSPLCEAIERFNEHAGDCFVCRNPMRSYQSTRPRCDTGDRVSRPIRDEFERLRSLQPSGEDDEGSSGASNGSGIINIPEAYGYSAKLVGVLNVISASEEHIVPSTSNGGRGRSDSRTTSSFVRVYMVSKKSKKKSDVVNEDLAKESNPIKSAAEKTTMPTQVHSDGDEESDFVDDLDGWDEDEDGIWDDETLWKEDSRLNPVESNDIPPISDENGLIIFDPVSRSHDLSNPLVEAKDDDVYINDDHLIIIDDYSEPPAFKLLRPKKDVGCRFLIPSRPEVQVEIVTVLEILIPVAMTNKETLQDTVIGHIERRHGIIFNRRTGEKIKQLNSKDGKNVGHTFSPIVPVAGISLEELGPIEFEPGSKSSAHHQKQCREKTILDPDFRGRYGECYCDMDDEFSSKELLDAYTQALMSSPPEPDSDEDSDELSESDELERYY
ncbi:hypothetical protein BJ508DRAFT_128194 [Ascobolus immersus RN42]|uniref:Ubiquitin-like domain-containing protein n=1 Tax=Ascobolus immersus RN42 TaxID=1160509 RepID=A0A3N4I780_ASCIM|nr:hypothetical protein BJ508DRAFT_128194 [Ascobolus immersus RN42]